MYHGEVVITYSCVKYIQKLIFSDDNNSINTEQYATTPLNLVKILIDTNEIGSSKLIERLHSKILIYVQIDTHHIIE